MQNLRIGMNYSMFLTSVTGRLVVPEYFVLQRCPGVPLTCAVFKCAVSNMLKLRSNKLPSVVMMVVINR